MEITAIQLEVMEKLDVNFDETWSVIGESLQHEIIKASFQCLGNGCSDSTFHRRIYAISFGIFQNLVMKKENQTWKFLHQIILDEFQPVSGQNNVAVFLVRQLLGHPSYQQFVNDCIFRLLKNMTTGVGLDQVSLNVCYYKNLDGNSPVKQAGIGLYDLVGDYMSALWPICCRQLQRLIEEENGLLKTIKLLIGLLDYRHSGQFIKERTQEFDDLVQNVLEKSGNNSMVLNLSWYVNWIQQAHLRDNNEECKNI